jgi:hypothetical protein
MRAIAYIFFIFLLSSGGSSKSYANNLLNHNQNKTVKKISKSSPIKYSNTNHNSIAILDTDIEIEEEWDQTHGFKNSDLKKMDYEKYLFSNQLQSLLITPLNLDHFLNKNKNFARCCRLQNPIYITLQVLRI